MTTASRPFAESSSFLHLRHWAWIFFLLKLGHRLYREVQSSHLVDSYYFNRNFVTDIHHVRHLSYAKWR